MPTQEGVHLVTVPRSRLNDFDAVRPDAKPQLPGSFRANDTVVDAAARDRLPQAGALAEAVRRRRATGGPAEHTFATLVGLELRPRRSREAAAIWRGLTQARGTEGRDAVWAHPDLLPTAEDFDDPDGFVSGKNELDMSELEAGTADTPGTDATPAADATPDTDGTGGADGTDGTPGEDGTPDNGAK